ncbi:hypothetical protein K491DRAFT_710319 [Lophiostoma macrostomum CBS 122681]|uniref:HMG box domain-containing protein n=1 Tax=Lophiostoma macrostomum CBS 122681 TaxID=1314788 RepID=A0A6A6TRD0_9PLEO|nr:hypothetical protein K491DRAFT_710319 [Lophiostoma macrostomum CBS 122681]
MPPPSTPAASKASPSKGKPRSRKKTVVITGPVAYQNRSQQVIMALSNLQNGLSHVQNGLSDLLRAYMQHTASILAGGADTLENLQLPAHIAASANATIEAAQSAGSAIAQATQVQAAPAPTAEGGKRKRKREKKERDPNAPKRPLTAAFLFSQHARSWVRQDLESVLGPGEKLEPNAVNVETTKRWNEMTEDQKEKWKDSYRKSLVKYKAEMQDYLAKKGITAPVELHDDEEPSDEAEAGAMDSDVSSDSEDMSAAIEPPPVAKAPSPPAAKTPRPNKRQKTAQTPHANGSSAPVPIAPATTSTPIPLPGSDGSKTPAQTQIPLPNATPAPAKEKKDKKKKDKATPQPIAPAPSATKEPSPDDTKKKSKSRSTRNTEVETETPAEGKSKKRDRSKRKSEGVTA